MYEKDGKSYFVGDGHPHFSDASPGNRNRFGEKYSEEDYFHDLFLTW